MHSTLTPLLAQATQADIARGGARRSRLATLRRARRSARQAARRAVRGPTLDRDGILWTWRPGSQAHGS